ncbi:MAG: peptidoglycan-associated lipoprotein Pal [Pseudomonadota bacterium]
MTTSKVLMALVAGLALSACSSPDRFDNPSTGAGTGAAGGINGTGGVTASALDPTSQAYFQQTVGDTVTFAVDQSTLSADARAVLDGQANWLIDNPGFVAVIEGHADEQGTREYNLALGARRSNAVRDYLVSRGVDGDRMKTLTFGKERPLQVCSSEACYAANRRAMTALNAAGL